MAKEKGELICFVLAPIGADGSEIRIRSDQVLKHIIGPAARDCGYEPIRADQISEPGLITSQVIQHVVEDALVIADLTGRNPNVFYELAIRHAVRKPVVQIIHATETIPFDVAASRTIHVDHHDLDSAARAREEIVRQIKAVERNPLEVDTPISVAVELQSLRQSDNPLEKSNAEIISMLQEIRTGMVNLGDAVHVPRLDPRLIDELLFMIQHIHSRLDTQEGKEITREQLDDLRADVHRFERNLEHLIFAGISPRSFRMRRPVVTVPPKKEKET